MRLTEHVQKLFAFADPNNVMMSELFKVLSLLDEGLQQ